MKRSIWLRVVVAIATTVAGGTLLQTGCARRVARNFNPCGTVFDESFCDPFEYGLLFAEPQDWDTDPTCTIPGLCDEWPPTTPPGGTETTDTTG